MCTKDSYKPDLGERTSETSEGGLFDRLECEIKCSARVLRAFCPRSATVKALGLARFQLKYSAGPLPHEKLKRSIELYGRKVVPMVRDMLA